MLTAGPSGAGMHKDGVTQIADLVPERFVYVGCSPETQARDLERLRDTYRVDAVQPVDMFPNTPHVETVVRLSYRS